MFLLKLEKVYKEVDSYTKSYQSIKREINIYKNEIKNLELNNDKLYKKNKELTTRINGILKAIKKFFRKLLQLGSEIIKEATVNEIKGYFDNKIFKKKDVVDISVDTAKEDELFENDAQHNDSRGHIFYCDPQRPDQKPHVENNHNFVRNILPNGRNLQQLTQADLNLMFSHINSVPRANLGGKTPYEVFTYFYGDSVLQKLEIQKIEKDMVTLQPYLLKIK